MSFGEGKQCETSGEIYSSKQKNILSGSKSDEIERKQKLSEIVRKNALMKEQDEKKRVLAELRK